MKQLINAALILASPLANAEINPEEVSLFDGKSLAGWTAVNANNAHYWSVVDGVITASNGDKKMPTNTYLASDKHYQNFEFRCMFRLSGDHQTGLINSGIQYRSVLKRNPNKPGVNHIIGYQADIGKGYWGDLYDEHRRGKLAGGDNKALLKNFKEDGWNEYIIRCNGDRHQLLINGHQTVAYTESQPNIESYGVIALQLHSGGIAKMEYKDISITEYPATPLTLPLAVSATEAKIHGKTMTLRNGMIVSWNKTNEYLEWTVPAHLKAGNYRITLNYSCDTNRHGSAMSFSCGKQKIDFQTKGKTKDWSADKHPIGTMKLKAGDKVLLKCSTLKADWVLDFHGIEFEAVK